MNTSLFVVKIDAAHERIVRRMDDQRLRYNKF